MHGNKQADASGRVGLGLPLHGDVSDTDVCFLNTLYMLPGGRLSLKADWPLTSVCFTVLCNIPWMAPGSLVFLELPVTVVGLHADQQSKTSHFNEECSLVLSERQLQFVLSCVLYFESECKWKQAAWHKVMPTNSSQLHRQGMLTITMKYHNDYITAFLLTPCCGLSDNGACQIHATDCKST